MRKTLLIGALLATAACANSNRPERHIVQHPSAEDLRCPGEPPALTDAQVAADTSGALEEQFNDAVLLAGRGCRDALARVCGWHVERGLELPAGISCEGRQPSPAGG